MDGMRSKWHQCLKELNFEKSVKFLFGVEIDLVDGSTGGEDLDFHVLDCWPCIAVL